MVQCSVRVIVLLVLPAGITARLVPILILKYWHKCNHFQSIGIGKKTLIMLWGILTTTSD